MAEAKDERIYTVPFSKAFDYVRTRRLKRVLSLLRAFVARHSKVAEKEVRISEKLNAKLWERGIQKPPRKIKIKVLREGGMARAYLVDEKVEKKEKAKPEAGKKAEAKPEAKPETARPKAETAKTTEEKKEENKAIVPKAADMPAPREPKTRESV